ncbi:MAG: DUF4352 domain-containing protein [Candidatus Omnitrophota bacterium]
MTEIIMDLYNNIINASKPLFLIILGFVGVILAFFLVIVFIGFLIESDNSIHNNENTQSSLILNISTPRTLPMREPKPTKTPTLAPPPTLTPTPAPRYFKEKQDAKIGYMSYYVYRSWWSNRISNNPYLNVKPNAVYLFVEISIRNDDLKARSIPPFNLVDERGAEYEMSHRGMGDNFITTVFESLNPGVARRGFLLFDIPQQNRYRIKVSGGFWSGVDTYIELSPK